jgi:hypothetical protein
MRDYRVDAKTALEIANTDSFVFPAHRLVAPAFEAMELADHRETAVHQTHDVDFALADSGAGGNRTDEEKAQDRVENRHFKAQYVGMTIAEELHLRDAFWDWSFV